ncbi:TetR family transcriptional regulator C-terminal domain-containing protein [Virgibacillus sp. 179-BFC.A HS]|uniref:TetR family transcriptional regulator C-terminal domain-containing protein n=1 Tax=Tigheibacillus jepli TaxID=3035914 RepID=A0ABU5CEM7_9BACI|nr:TetR family transcriptional regulator C-terminal domain-containing protein [Virgibacillus sp. 179-BFC.A HS]MDY0404307.1 TetR family transcriptional regulator C-terminal domain-containing protein [Virgibacillus sp. 179-BFC.A HS]
MPKIVNHDDRREKIARATWQVILDKGMEGATVRNIAKEAGLSLGALRYYFKSQDELLVYAMELVKNRATKRITAVSKKELPPKEMAIEILMEIVPTNAQTRAEMEVWLAFVTYMKPRKHAKLHINDDILQGMEKIMQYLSATGNLRAELDVSIETERLYAFIDGLALHALLHPEHLSPEQIRKTITYHIDQICIF